MRPALFVGGRQTNLGLAYAAVEKFVWLGKCRYLTGENGTKVPLTDLNQAPTLG
jgi:hypothetical protein